MPICTKCGRKRKLSDFGSFIRSGRPQRRSHCNACRSSRARSVETAGSPEAQTAWRERRRRHESSRADPDSIAKWILIDSKKQDRKRGLENDLDEDSIKKLVQNGCSYCAATDMRMTLDRVDNAMGHTLANVRPACIRCNMMRGDMPWEAWNALVPHLRPIRESGLFGTWRSSTKRITPQATKIGPPAP